MTITRDPTTDEYAVWKTARLGKVTASRIADVVGQKKDGSWKADRKSYFYELIAERLTGMSPDGFFGGSMLWGVETEPMALKAYANRTGSLVTRVGFIDHGHMPMAGCSPDALVDDDGLVEVKCTETRTLIRYRLERLVPEEYKIQMQWQMACTGRRFCDFLTYDPRLPSSMALYTVRVNRDDKLIKNLEKAVIAFNQEIEQAIEALDGGHIASEHV